MSVELAGAPVSWGVDFAQDPENPDAERVLDGIAAAGLRFMELGPCGFLPASAAALASRGIASVGTFVFQPFHEPGAREAILAATHDALAWLTIHGGRLLVLVDRPEGDRAATAGRSAAARRLEAPAWRAMIATIERVALLAADHGVRAVVHPHAGTRIEFADEIDRLLAELAPETAGLCLDTGHALYAGDDPCELLLRHRDRIEHVHVKDVDRRRLAEAIARGTGFWSAMAGGVFCPAGDGALELAAFAEALGACGYTGFATIEQDRRRASPGVPEDDLRRTVARLRRAGIG